mgnify:CR=1 FL=1
MIVKGIIKTINFSENSCTVRLPLFETAAAQGEVILDAIISIQPGLYNGYTEGDVVFVDFENNKLSQPIIVGKLYLGAAKEAAAGAPSAMTVSNLKVTTQATLPVDTRLSLEGLGNIVPVEKGISSYHSLVDIIKALHQTETSVQQTIKDQSGTVANIIVEYLSLPVDQEAPTAESVGWSTSTPSYQDGFAIWQKTTCYNHRGQLLSTEIICLSAVASSAIYSLRCSTKVHSGPNQLEDVTVTAMVKLGSEPEIEDTAAKLYYKWGDDGSEQAVQTVIEEELEDGTTKEVTITHTFKILAKQLEEKNLIIIFKHENENLGITLVLNTETIMYSPLATPNLVLSNDTDTILYSAAGEVQTSPSSIATLYLNGDELEATYDWSFTNCEGTCSEDKRTVTIVNLVDASKAAKAVCTATVTAKLFENNQYIREFTVTPTKVGTSIDLQTRYYALIHPDFAAGSIKAPTDDDDLKVKKVDGTLLDRLDQADTEEEIEAARTWGEWSTTPQAHTDKTRTQSWKYWTTVRTAKSDNTVTFSNPIINEDLNGVYALAQGKTTNYYSDTDPAEDYILKKGDCWFKTTGTNNELATKADFSDAPATGELKQWTGTEWKDIGSEIVANKLTATYINALDITAKKIEILNENNDVVFKADGISKVETPVQIAGFGVSKDGLFTTGFGDTYNKAGNSDTGVYLGKDGLKLGKKFSVSTEGKVTATDLTIQNMTASGTSGIKVKGGKFTVETKDTSPTTLFEVDSSASKTTLSGNIHNTGNIFSGCKLETVDGKEVLTQVSGATGNIYSGGIVQSIGGIVNNNTLVNTGIIYSNGGIVNDGTIASKGIIYSNGGIINDGTIASTGFIHSDGVLAAGGDVVFYATVSGSGDSINITGYKPVIRIENDKSPDCFWSASKTVGGNTWTTISLPNALKGKVISVACSANQTKQGLYRPTNGSGKNDTQYNSAELTGFIANAWYVDYSSDVNNIWVFNGQEREGTLNIIVAAKIKN